MTTLDAGGSAVALAWKRYRAWALTSRNLKSAYERSYRWVSVLSLAGAILGILAQQLATPGNLDATESGLNEWLAGLSASGLNKGLALVSAICVAVSAYLARQLLGVEREHQWVQARGLAEAIKSQLHLFWMRVEPYQESASEAVSPQKRLLDKVSELEKVGEHIHREDPAEMDKAPPAESSMGIDEYIQLRIEDQIKYYRAQGRNHQTRLRRYQITGLILGLVGTLLGVFGATDSGARLVGWVAVVSTAAMVVTGFATTGRYQYLTTTYRAAADRLEYLLGVWSTSQKTQEDHNTLVLDVEAVLRVENSAWLVERTKSVSTEEAKKPKPQP